MSSSLFAALSGLQANQSWIDLIGNNLSNSNTPGFKTSQATFSDRFVRTLQYATSPTTGLGGRNPAQVGTGVQMANTMRNFAQGGLTRTGRVFDLALQGNGFFTLASPGGTVYTRVGSFGLDGASNLIDLRTGAQVLDPSGRRIVVDTQSQLPPNATSSAVLAGNLPKEVGGPLQEVLTATAAFAHGSPATSTSLNAGPYAIPAGQTWTMQVQVGGSAPQSVSLTSVTGTVTAADVATAIDALNGVSSSVDGTGRVVITTDATGDTSSFRVLPGSPGTDLAGLVGFSGALVQGSQTNVGAATTLDDLPANLVGYAAGDQIHVTGVDGDGTAINAVFTYGPAADGTTLNDLVTFIDAQYPGATVTLDTTGRLVVTADTAGTADLQLVLMDDPGNVGSTDWTDYAMSVTTEGTPPDIVTAAAEVFDRAGVAHTLSVTFERQQDGTWTGTPSIPTTSGAVTTPPITGLTFDDGGAPVGFGALNLDVQVSFAGQTSPQTIALDFGADGSFDGLTQFGAEGAVFVQSQDGYGVGSLSSLAVDTEGAIIGLYSNGESQELGRIGVARFLNPEGLHQVGNNMYAESLNSGAPALAGAQTGGSAEIVSGAVEASNVDVAEQFVYLIQAQRGFQANARVVTVENEVLRDTVNLV